MKCNIVKDLLPNYIDGLNSEETNREIKKHLDECADCHTVYERMAVEIPQEIHSEDKDIDFLKKLKRKMLRKNVIVAISTCIIVLGGLLIWAKAYEIPIPFDQDRMTVELIPVAVIPNEDGSTAWWELSLIEQPERWVLPSHIEVPIEYESVMEKLSIAYHGFDNISSDIMGRNINRNGESVRVVYYRYTKTPWTSLFFDYDLTDYRSEGWRSGTGIYGDSYESSNYEPQMIEIYYLPIRNLHSLNNLSDEDFDAQRENAYPVWNGVI